LAVVEQEENLFVVDTKTIEAEDRLKELEAERELQEHMAKIKANTLAMEEKERIEEACRRAEEREKENREAELALARQEYSYKIDWEVVDFKQLPDSVFEDRREYIKKAIAPAINELIKAGMKNIPGVKIEITKSLKV